MPLDQWVWTSGKLCGKQRLWQINQRLFLKQENEGLSEPVVKLPSMTLSEHVVEDYSSMSLKAHPDSFVREKLRKRGIINANKLHLMRDGSLIKVAGLVLVRQRPGTAGGVCFMTVEDETGFSNLVIFKNLFEKFRKEILGSKLIMAE